MGAVLNDRREDAAPYILGAVLAALILPALVLGLSAPLWLGVLVALAVLVCVIGAAKLAHRHEATLHAPGAAAPARAVLAEAAPALQRLETAAAAIATLATRAHVGRIADAARLIIASVDEDPTTLAAVQRVLTYYLPRSAAIAESYRVLEARGGADRARMTRIEAIIARLDIAFQHYADRLADDALRLLDVELRLVDAAMRDDLDDVP